MTDLVYSSSDEVSAEEMQALEESVGFGQHRTLERNRTALAGSVFVATARRGGDLVGLIRLVGDGAYILHVAGLTVRPDVQRRGIGRRLVEMAVAFARQTRVGSGGSLGEFTLFANTDADTFYEKLGFTLVPNGMVLTDSPQRKQHEVGFQEQWCKARKEKC